MVKSQCAALSLRWPSRLQCNRGNERNTHWQLCAYSIGDSATWFLAHRRLEHRPWPAAARGHKFPRHPRCGHSHPAGIRPQCASHTWPEYNRGDCPETADELCIRAGVSGTRTRLQEQSGIPRPGYSGEVADLESAPDPFWATIKFL